MAYEYKESKKKGRKNWTKIYCISILFQQLLEVLHLILTKPHEISLFLVFGFFFFMEGYRPEKKPRKLE